MRYGTEVYVRRLSIREVLKNYVDFQAFQEACRFCPNYGKVWSCPPALPDICGYLEPYEQVFVIIVKVLYPAEIRMIVSTVEDAKLIRQQSYEQVKKRLLLALLVLEEELQAGKCLGAGRCILCEHCAREAGKPCRYPEKRRYSVTGFGFDFTKILQEVFDIKLFWNSEGLPDYDVAAAMFLI